MKGNAITEQINRTMDVNEPHDPDLKGRVDALERELTAIRERLDLLASGQKGIDSSRPVTNKVSAPQRRVATEHKRTAESTTERRALSDRILGLGSSEQWINRVGMSLLLLGLVFLFKYSIDRGWLTPLIRVIFGGVLGIALVGVGSRLKASRTLGLILLGGGIAVLYTTLFAAYQLYDMIPYLAAFIGMVCVTLVGYYFAIQQSTSLIAIVATIGGLSTPFLLYNEGGSLPAFVIYTCLVVGSAVELYYHKGWRSVLLAAFVGGWGCLIAGWVIPDFDWILGLRPVSEGIVYQGGIVFALLALGVLPSIRIHQYNNNPGRWPTPNAGIFKNLPTFYQPAHLLVIFSPLIAAAITTAVWEPDDVVLGLIFLGVAILYSYAYLWLFGRNSQRLASMHGFVGAIFLALAIGQLVENNDLVIMLLAVEVAALVWLGYKKDDAKIIGFAHAGFAIIGLVMLDRLDYSSTESPVLNLAALCDLVITCAFIFAGWISRHRLLRTGYFLFGYFCYLSLLARELSLFDNGQAYVTVAWGVTAIALLVAARMFTSRLVRLMGLGTLALVVGKLLFVDLAQIDAGWRVLLFLGLGGLLLLLSYFFPQLWELPGSVEEDELDDQARDKSRPDSNTEAVSDDVN